VALPDVHDRRDAAVLGKRRRLMKTLKKLVEDAAWVYGWVRFLVVGLRAR
jgi:hypothetical protein